METGRFQPPTEQERFGRAPDGAEGLSGSFVRTAYGATGVKQNPGEFRGPSEPSPSTPFSKQHPNGGIL
ncbi:hypothetical protein [Desulfitobacterium dehalogenans]|uniref:hypothetical protein n=1 Tax=Desulfitobacterium dehalogenans TaxID=36854 RepID=UPI0002DFB97A|nr:hypothetical protein [Desulfitobacterium dehalogenans]